MKLLSTITILLGLTSVAYAESSCTLSRSGVQDTFVFQDYETTITDDLFDPACIKPMGRLCSKVKVSKSELYFEDEVKVVHKIIEPHQRLSQTRKHSQFIIYQDGEWLATYDGHYDSGTASSYSRLFQYYVSPKFTMQIGAILEGGYIIECK